MKTTSTWRHLFLLAATPFLSLASPAAQALAPPLSIQPLQHQPHYTCEFPLLGSQSVFAELENTASTFIFDWDSYRLHLGGDLIFPDSIHRGMKLVNSHSLSGRLSLDTVFVMRRYTQLGTITEETPFSAQLDIPETVIPDDPGELVIPVEGSSYKPTFPSGMSHLSVVTGDMRVVLAAVDRNGESAPAYGEVDTLCEQTSQPDPQGVAVNPETIDFGSVISGFSKTEAVTVSNSGRDRMVENVWLEGDTTNAFSLHHNCTTLIAGRYCTIDVTYIPPAPGAHSAQLVIDAEGEQGIVQLQGQSEDHPLPDMRVSPDEVNFGTVDPMDIVTLELTVANIGTAAAELSGIEISGEDAVLFQASSECGNSIAPQASCTVEVTFWAAKMGAAQAMLDIKGVNTTRSIQVPLRAARPENPCDLMGAPLISDVAGTVTFSDGNRVAESEGQFEFPTPCQDAPGLLYLMPFETDLPEIRTLFGSLDTKASVEFEQTGPFEITSVQENHRQAEVAFHLRVPEVNVRVFGLNMTIGGGPECRTADPFILHLGIQSQPLEIDGTFEVGPFENCGLATSYLNRALQGKDNTLTVAPVQQQGL